MIQILVGVEKNRCYIKRLDTITSGCVNSVCCKFSFDSEWDMFQTRIASFERYDSAYHTIIENDMCMVPNFVINKSGELSFGVIGIDKSGDVTITTNIVKIRVVQGADKCGQGSPEYTPTLVEQLVKIANDAKSIAQSVRDDADNGLFGGKSSVLNAKTHYDFPSVGDESTIYKAEAERQLYQWNPSGLKYELLSSGSGGVIEIDLINGGNANGNS